MMKRFQRASGLSCGLYAIILSLTSMSSTCLAQENAAKPAPAKPEAAALSYHAQMLQAGGDVPLLLLDTSDKVWAMHVTSGSQLYVRRGNVMVNSSNKGAFWATEANSLIQVDKGAIGVVGGTTLLGNPTIRPAPQTGFQPMADPFPAFEVPQDARVVSREKINHQRGDLALAPGIYDGGLWVTARDATVTMQPGTYIIRGGDFAVWHSRLIGEGVTIVLLPGDKPAGSFNTQFGAQVELSAPTTGPLQNLVILSAAKGNGQISMQDTQGMIKGTIYGPQAEMKLSGGSRVSVTRVICNNLSLVLKAALEITGADMPGQAGADAAPAPANANAAAVQPALAAPGAVGQLQWAKGQGVEIFWGNKWWKGRILAVDEANGKYKVHYDGWGDNWDEWVTPDKLR
jgi:hypothetical protein